MKLSIAEIRKLISVTLNSKKSESYYTASCPFCGHSQDATVLSSDSIAKGAAIGKTLTHIRYDHKEMIKEQYKLIALKNIWIASEKSNYTGGISTEYVEKGQPCAEIHWLHAVSETENQPKSSHSIPHPEEVGETTQEGDLFTLERIE